MWKDLHSEKKVTGPSEVITSLDPSHTLNWAKSSYNPSKLLGYGTTYGGETGVGNPCERLFPRIRFKAFSFSYALTLYLLTDGSSKQSQTAYDMAYLLNGKYHRKEAVPTK